ncbi:protein [Lentinula edodes]|uniref:Protein n=1 Tax=Lentinula edodes TaxID=5353 RepID=A0A1Q3EIX2_LENED|nr:protein [Lentinula edodes]
MATPALIDQINAAAATNPILASLLQLANAGQATPDQLHMLSITIRSLAANPLPASQYSSLNAQNSSALSATPESNKEFDLVIEFEASSNRFIFPRGTTVCERVSGSEDIVVTSYIQLQNSSSMQKITEESQGQSSSKYRMLRLSLHGASESLWDSLNRWAGGEDIMNANRKTLNKLKDKQPRKTYLAYRLPEGLLLDHIKAAVSAPYPMKALKPPASLLKSRRIRKPVTKTPQELERSSLDTQTNAKPPRRKRSAAELNAALDLAAAITGAGSVANYSPTQSIPPPPKKRKQRTTLKSEYQSQPAATEIKCRSCQATDVPLMLGGRFCRPCVEAGRGIADIPQLPNYTRAPQASAYIPKYILPPLPLPPMATHHFTLMDPTSRYPSATISGPRPDVVASYALNNIHSGTLATPNLTTMTNIPTNQSTPPNVEN